MKALSHATVRGRPRSLNDRYTPGLQRSPRTQRRGALSLSPRSEWHATSGSATTSVASPSAGSPISLSPTRPASGRWMQSDRRIDPPATNASFEGGAEWSPAPAKLLRTRVDRPVDMGERGEDGHGRVGRVGAATLCVALRVTSYELLYVF